MLDHLDLDLYIFVYKTYSMALRTDSALKSLIKVCLLCNSFLPFEEKTVGFHDSLYPSES